MSEAIPLTTHMLSPRAKGQLCAFLWPISNGAHHVHVRPCCRHRTYSAAMEPAAPSGTRLSTMRIPHWATREANHLPVWNRTKNTTLTPHVTILREKTRFLRARLRSKKQKETMDTRGSNFKGVTENVCLDFPTLHKTADDGRNLRNSCLCKGRGKEQGSERGSW
jgi:hypothetical protein